MYNYPPLEKKNHNINSPIYGTSYINKINPDKAKTKNSNLSNLCETTMLYPYLFIYLFILFYFSF